MARSFDNLYIGGSWVPAGDAFDDLNPADGSVWRVSLTGIAAWLPAPFNQRRMHSALVRAAL